MRAILLFLLIVLFQLHAPVLAARERGILVVQVTDVNDRPVKGIVLSLKGEGGPGATTDEGGIVRIQLAAYIKATNRVTLQLLSSPRNNMDIISPWNKEVIIPSFENGVGNYLSVVVVEKGDKALLQNGMVLTSLTNKILANIQKQKDDLGNPELQLSKMGFEVIKQAALAAIAAKYGLQPDDMEKAISDWGVKTNDNYQKGLAALFQGNYAAATPQLYNAYDKRKANFEKSKDDFFDVVYNLANSLAGEEKYIEAAAKYEEAAALKPDEMKPLFYMASMYTGAGEYKKAVIIRKKIKTTMEENLDLFIKERVNGILYTYNVSLIGRIFFKNDQPDSALLYQRKALIFGEALKESKDSLNYHAYIALRTYTFDDIAEVYAKKEVYDTAIIMEDSAIVNLKKLYGDTTSQLGPFYGRYSEYLFKSGHTDAALPFARNAISIMESAPINSFNLLQFYLNLIVIESKSNSPTNEKLATFTKADKYLKQIWKSSHTFFSALYRRIAELHEVNGTTDSALQYYKTAADIAFVNKDTAIYKNAFGKYWEIEGNKYSNTKHFKEACMCYDSAWFYGKVFWNLHFEGVCYYKMDEYQKAIGCYHAVLLLDTAKSDHYIYNDLGVSHANLGHLDSAYYYFTLFEALHIDTAVSYRNWAMYYALKNDKEKALQNLENAILYGYTNQDWITTAKSLAAIREDERYKRLVEGLKKGEKKN